MRRIRKDSTRPCCSNKRIRAQCYIKVRSTSSMHIPLYLSSPEKTLVGTQQLSMLDGLFYGINFTVAMLALLIFIATYQKRECS